MVVEADGWFDHGSAEISRTLQPQDDHHSDAHKHDQLKANFDRYVDVCRKKQVIGNEWSKIMVPNEKSTNYYSKEFCLMGNRFLVAKAMNTDIMPMSSVTDQEIQFQLTVANFVGSLKKIS